MTVPVKSKPTPALVRLLVVPLTAAVLVGGLWLTAGLLVSTYNGAIVVAVAWFVVAAVVIRFIVRARPDLRWLLRGTFLLTVVRRAVAAPRRRPRPSARAQRASRRSRGSSDGPALRRPSHRAPV